MRLIPEAVVQRCSAKKVFLEISQNSQQSTCARVSFLIKLQTSIVTPTTSTEGTTSISSEPTVILLPVFCDFCLSDRMAWNLSRFTNIILPINHSMTMLHSDCNSYRKRTYSYYHQQNYKQNKKYKRKIY